MFKLYIEGAYIQEERGGDVNIFYTGSQLYTYSVCIKPKFTWSLAYNRHKMHTFHRNENNLENKFLLIYICWIWRFQNFKLLPLLQATLAPYQSVTCLQPIGDTWHICRKSGNETGQYLV